MTIILELEHGIIREDIIFIHTGQLSMYVSIWRNMWRIIIVNHVLNRQCVPDVNYLPNMLRHAHHMYVGACEYAHMRPHTWMRICNVCTHMNTYTYVCLYVFSKMVCASIWVTL